MDLWPSFQPTLVFEFDPRSAPLPASPCTTATSSTMKISGSWGRYDETVTLRMNGQTVRLESPGCESGLGRTAPSASDHQCTPLKAKTRNVQTYLRVLYPSPRGPAYAFC